MNPSPQDTVIKMIADLSCPWCYIGRERLEIAIAQRNEDSGAKFVIEHVPFRLNPHFAPEGMSRRDYRVRKFGSWEESQHRDAAVEIAAHADGLPINFSKIDRTPATLAGHCLIGFVAREAGADEAAHLTRALYAAYFEDGQDIGDLTFLGTLAESHGLSRDAALACITSRNCLETIISTEQHWAAQGIAGVPAFVLPSGALISGAASVAELTNQRS